MRLESYPSRPALMQGVAMGIAAELRVALLDGAATLSVPGGTTPGPVFDLLARHDLDWARVAVLLNDERWVGEDSPRSNTRLLRARLLQGRAAAATLVPLYAALPTPEDGLARLSRGIEPHLPLTVLLLGMGSDMHTASLFPGADLLAEAMAPDAPVLMALRAEAAGEPRITLTARVLQAARHIHILITGADKRGALERAMQLPVLEAPIRAVLDRATVHWAE
ncbi:MAG: 6-phosphogluconolactonase [bacterium]